MGGQTNPRPERVARLLEDEFIDVQDITEAALGRIWLRKEEDVWNRYLEARKK
jgi:hypothetical protein